MIYTLKGGKVFSPDYLGEKDILIANDKIELLDDTIICPYGEIYDLTGKIVVPGFIDAHVHIAGGGGEGGFVTRTPEITFDEIVNSGITTIVGCLGTDDITRNLEGLYAKAKALELRGITSYIYTGSYSVPPVTFTGSIKKDLVLIDKVIGVGEIAISDHRSSQPSFEEIKKIVAKARVGGLISGKAGVVNFHVGSGSCKIEYLLNILKENEIPAKHMYPTHMGRSDELFSQGILFAKKGGFIDLTASIDMVKYLEIGIYENIYSNMTMTSDGQGSLPKFGEDGNLIELNVGSVSVLFETVRYAANKGLNFEKLLKMITENPAKVLGLKNKGRIKSGNDADIVILNEDMEIEGVIAKGKFVRRG
ncbi:isoaspartyl dipeptidase [Thermosipho melanesiensis]|uniref:Isoaspartyl dipeptidase n=2 Tax=Thermosipho melanesiensis TaxID=46541 RepID=A6LKL4_THEM4|nr:beta-aspartyl-peptidase [Thermosipho melanesiensis]ABR30465.1 isoaspartyl dipeptidase [Thermosipho melanesiensis BI429]APT73623.1 isoaspartyl dipeptidase [Thermosipho melanesiensis]OOC37572.1 isoaspartyl dipeptidase [Thermosipho melanesiensis]OOC39468.1 isoaspartyl dipeptidase [Thermosipho melanesiensis]OOC39531.1 isoaspartyl dipeptidase [Thermosipho melanesiensis]